VAGREAAGPKIAESCATSRQIIFRLGDETAMNGPQSRSHIVFGVPKLPARFGSLVMSLLLSVFMTCIVSMISTYRGIGADPHFFRIWLGAWAISWVIAFPTLLVALPIVRRATLALVRTA
jgi:hypothetical protein